LVNFIYESIANKTKFKVSVAMGIKIFTSVCGALSNTDADHGKYGVYLLPTIRNPDIIHINDTNRANSIFLNSSVIKNVNGINDTSKNPALRCLTKYIMIISPFNPGKLPIIANGSENTNEIITTHIPNERVNNSFPQKILFFVKGVSNNIFKVSSLYSFRNK
jgi:hypothetical protein